MMKWNSKVTTIMMRCHHFKILAMRKQSVCLRGIIGYSASTKYSNLKRWFEKQMEDIFHTICYIFVIMHVVWLLMVDVMLMLLVSNNSCVVTMLLVSKNDGTWRIYVNYYVVNNTTIKYKHLIPRLSDMLKCIVLVVLQRLI